MSNEEAIADGFEDNGKMFNWFKKTYGEKLQTERINKITIRVIAYQINVTGEKPKAQDYDDIVALINSGVNSGVDTPRIGLTWEIIPRKQLEVLHAN